MSQDTVRKGITELAAPEVDPEAPIGARLREPGASPKRLIDKDPEFLERLKQMVDPVTRGRERASGTRSSIACFRTSLRTGEDDL